jgi:hypothetical protein
MSKFIVTSVWCCVFLSVAVYAMPAAAANLVANGNFQTSTLTPSTSNYSFSPGMQPAGTWNITSFDTFHPAWVDLLDHTLGNGNGRYMIVNGTSAAEGKAWAQTVTVAPDSYYTLSAWFANLHAPSTPAPLNFRIMNGASPLATRFIQSPAVAGQWGQRNMTFYTGAATSLSVEIWDTNAYVSSRDYAIDDISLLLLGEPDDVGDFGRDGAIDTSDYAIWRKEGRPAEQRLAWVRYFDPTGNVLYAGSGGAVPEPASVTTALIAVCGFFPIFGRNRQGRS